MRAIYKMVEKLEHELASHEYRYGRELTRHHLEKARRLAEEKSGSEGLMEYTSKKCIRSCNCIGPKNCYDRTCPLVIELDNPAHPTPKEAVHNPSVSTPREQKITIDADMLVWRIESILGECEKEHGNPGRAIVEIGEVVSRCRPAPDRTGELVRLCKEAVQVISQCRDWDGDSDPLDSFDIEKAQKILRDFEGGA